MIKKLFTVMRYSAIVALVAGLFVISGCDNGDDGPVVFNGTTLDFIKSDEFKQANNGNADLALDSLVKYVAQYPDLTAILGSATEYTLFAPSNTAFKSLLATPGFPSNIALINPDIIKGVLAYHLVAGKKLRADMAAGTKFETLYTDPTSATVQKIEINSDGTTLKTGSTNQAIVIVAGGEDRLATNGVVHITGSVLIPPSVGASLTPILGTLAGTILLGKDFTNLAKVITAADAGFTENAANLEFKISTWLAMPISSASKPTANVKGFTFFAPPNKAGSSDVFTSGIASSLIASPDKGRSVILNHLLTSGQYTIAEPPANNPTGIAKFTDGQLLAPKTGETKTIRVSVGAASATNPFGVAISNTPAVAESYRPIVSKDLSHSNGTLQVFAGLLQ